MYLFDKVTLFKILWSIKRKNKGKRERNKQRHIKQGQRLVQRGDTHEGIKECPHPQGHNLYSKMFHCFPLPLIVGQAPQTSQTWAFPPSLCLKVCSLFAPWAKATLQDNISENRFYKEHEGKRGQVYIPRGERAWKGL